MVEIQIMMKSCYRWLILVYHEGILSEDGNMVA